MSDYWNRPRPRPQRERDDHSREGGGYFQGEPGGGNHPGRAHLIPDTDRDRHYDPRDDPHRWSGPDRDVDHRPPNGPRDPVRGEPGRGYGERGPGRVFDRGDEYGRGGSHPQHDRDDRRREGGGYFQGEPGAGNHPGRAHLPPESDPYRYHDPRDDPRRWRGPDRDTDHRPPSGPRDPVRGEAGRGYGGLSRRDYADRGPGRVFDRGEDYGRGDTYPPTRAGHGSDDPGEQPRRRRDW